jgi:hypothetical protein
VDVKLDGEDVSLLGLLVGEDTGSNGEDVRLDGANVGVNGEYIRLDGEDFGLAVLAVFLVWDRLYTHSCLLVVYVGVCSP